MEIETLTSNLQEQLNKLSADLSIEELDDMITKEGLTFTKPDLVQIQSTKSVEEPLSLNTRLINLGKSQTVTLLTCKTIYNAYRESDLHTLIRVGIIPNYEDLLDITLELLELLVIFVSRLEHKADISYINTPGMTMKEYKKLSSSTSDGKEKCENLLKTLKLNTNYALYIIQYNLLSGSTIIQELDKFKKQAIEACNILTDYCNTTSKNVDVNAVLSKYQTLRTTYEEVLKLRKESIATKLTQTFNKSSQIMLSLSKLEEEYSKRSDTLTSVETIVSKMDELQQRALLSKIHKLYEEQFIAHEKEQNHVESRFVDHAIKTLALYEKNYKATRENLDKLNLSLEKLVVSKDILDGSKTLEEIILKVKSLLETQKNHQDTIAHLKHVASELVDIQALKDEEE